MLFKHCGSLLAGVALLCLVGVGAGTAAGTAADAVEPGARAFLPDLSEGLVGRLGPFRWARAADFGEDVRFTDAQGLADPAGTHLLFYQFARMPRQRGVTHFIHARNNLTDRDPARAWQIQPKRFLHETSGAHNSKIIFGYMVTNWAFQHADNNDLAHLAGADRLVAFCPVRKDAHADPAAPANYRISAEYAAQSFAILEFKAGDIIAYEWFQNPRALDPHILCDLAPYVAGDRSVKPGVTQPLLRFDLGDAGRWTFRLERDGRDGLAGGDDPAGWDVVVTETAPGARRATVAVTPTNSAWAMSVFSPGGSPTDASEILIGFEPYARASGASLPWPSRTPRVREGRVGDPALDAPEAAGKGTRP